jgi:hypothetical protein
MAAVNAAPDDLNSNGSAIQLSPVKWDLDVCLRTRLMHTKNGYTPYGTKRAAYCFMLKLY